MDMGGLWGFVVGGGLTRGFWVVFEGDFGNLFLGCVGRKKKQIPGGNDRKKGKGNSRSKSKSRSKYRGLSTPHHKRQGRDAAVEMTGYG
jgi:hypothetical protein